ncbi:MAG: hypothetical protein IPM79_16460 [Polyangiaceae bacterium]|nr:hypothetical protein [Polyangiaceae bacterium]
MTSFGGSIPMGATRVATAELAGGGETLPRALGAAGDGLGLRLGGSAASARCGRGHALVLDRGRRGCGDGSAR